MNYREHLRCINRIALISCRIIEKNLNSLSKTPKVHYEEMLLHVYQPVLEKLEYPIVLHSAGLPQHERLLGRLLAAVKDVDVWNDPYVVDLRTKSDVTSQLRLEEVMRTRKTYCQKQLQSLCSKSLHILSELGPWAADYYIRSSIHQLCKTVAANDEQLSDFTDDEKAYLLNILNQVIPVKSVNCVATPPDENMEVSSKVSTLIGLLVKEDDKNFSGIVFVQQRAVVAVLSQLLSLHLKTKDSFRFGTFVGTSVSPKRKSTNITELLDVKQQKSTLHEFRSGKKNVVIATSVLEEGIDISACNIVICFDPPMNLKSFIQRRGRARKMKSKYVIMTKEGEYAGKERLWLELERQMKEAYMDDMRQLQAVEERESHEETYDERFEIEKTK